MMAVDRRQVAAADAIDLTRAVAASDRRLAERQVDARLLAAASMNVEGARRWFALRSANRGEVALVARLCASHVDAVVPVKQVQVGRRFQPRAAKVVHKPVLPGLVFVNLVPSDAAFAGLLRVRDVAAVVGKDGRPYPIGDREMNGFMDLAQAGAFDERNMPTGLVVGAAVKISVGAYADFTGVLQGYGRGRTARVLTWLFGREILVDVKLAHLEKPE